MGSDYRWRSPGGVDRGRPGAPEAPAILQANGATEANHVSVRVGYGTFPLAVVLVGMEVEDYPTWNHVPDREK